MFYSTFTQTLGARFFAAVTIVSFLLSAFPASFFVAEAAGEGTVMALSATSHTIPAATTVVSTADTTGFENPVLTFTYDAEALDNGEVFEYGWRESGGPDIVLGTIPGINNGPVGDESGIITSIPLGAGANNLPTLEIYFKHTGIAAADIVTVSNIVLTADLTVSPTCAAQVEAGLGSGPVKNTTTGQFFTTIQNAIDDCDTIDGNVITLTANIPLSAETGFNKDVTFDGKGFTIETEPSFVLNGIQNSVFEVAGQNGVTFRDFVIDGAQSTGLHGINLYLANGIKIEDVTIKNMDKSGIVVNGSVADVSNYTTSGNVWNAINVDISDDARDDGATESVLNISDTSVHGETNSFGQPGFLAHIYVDEVSKPITINDIDNQYLITDYPAKVPDTLIGRRAVPTARGYVLKTEAEPVLGCTDDRATNYNREATQDDGSCLYPLEIPQQCSILVEKFTVPANSSVGSNSSVLEAGVEYFAVVEGTYTFGAPKNGNQRLADAEYSLDAGTTNWVKEFAIGRPDVLDLFIDGVNPDFGAFRADHTYGMPMTGNGTAVNFASNDNPHSDNAGKLDVTIYRCEPEVATVTMCKYDESNNALAGWQLALLGDKQGEVSVLTNTSGAVQSLTAVPAGNYVVKASGTYVYRNPSLLADAAFSTRLPGDSGFATLPDSPWQSSTVYGPSNNYLGLQVNGSLPWGTVFNPSHVYYAPLTLATPGNVDFKITDTHYGDNVGSILAELYSGYTGVTEANGCVTFTDVPYGDYQVEELLQPNWQNVSGLTEVTVDSETETFTVVNRDMREVPVATIVAEKIVCDAESDLPNWNNNPGGAPKITETTAADFVAASNGACRLVPDWEFEWALPGVANPGDTLVGTGSANWHTFVPTDTNGKTQTTLTNEDISGKSFVWMREVLKDGYLGFSYADKRNNSNDETAEMYCHTDGVNYDNYDRVDGITVGNTYHCVAFNYELPKPLEQCELVMVSDEATVVVESNHTAVPTFVHDNWASNILDAIWVWNTEGVEHPNDSETYTFKESFMVTNPTEAKLIINADNWYKIRVNGVEVVNRNGTNSFATAHQKTFTTEILNELISGNNVIEFEVINAKPGSSANKFTNPAGLYYRLEVKGDKEARCEVTTAPRVASLVINTPAVDNEVVPRVAGFDFAATYSDDDDTVDNIQWAIRVGTCDAGVGTIAGNVDSFGDSSTFVGNQFSATLDTTLWAAGEYCFVVNPQEQAGETDLRATKLFTIDPVVVVDPNPNPQPERPILRITGTKFEVSNESEAVTPKANWIMNLYNTAGELAATTTTDSNGEYSFDVELGQIWSVKEALVLGWEQTDVEVTQGEVLTDASTDLEYCNFPLQVTAGDSGEGESQSENLTVLSDIINIGNCDFYNENQTQATDSDPTPESSPAITLVTTSGRSGGGGGRRNNQLSILTPTPLVLGATTDTPQFCPFLTDYMQMRVENDVMQVMKLQIFLNVFKSMFGGTENPVTGTFDATTDANVKAFQAYFKGEILTPWYESGIVPHDRPTGFVYKTTLWKINSIVCPGYAITPDYKGEDLTKNIKI